MIYVVVPQASPAVLDFVRDRIAGRAEVELKEVDHRGLGDRLMIGEQCKSIERTAAGGSAILMMGHDVQRAFGFSALQAWTQVPGGVTLIAVPHPGSHHWSDEGSDAGRQLESIVERFA